MAYLVHFNRNHSPKNGQFTSGDGDGDGIANDHAHKYKKLDRMSDKKLHKTLSEEIKAKRGSRYAFVGIGKNSKKYITDNKKKENDYRNSPEYKKWSKKLDSLGDRYEDGSISREEHDKEYKKLLSEKPKANYTNIYPVYTYTLGGKIYLNNYVKKSGKDLSVAYLKDLGYDDKKAKEYVDRLAKSNRTLGDE